MFMRQMALRAAAVALLFVPTSGQVAFAKQQRIQYAKTEVEKATSKCIGAILGGALLGGLLGGKKGAAIGAGAGSLICVILQVNAHNKDKIIAAQMAAAANMESGEYSEIMQDSSNRNVLFVAQAGSIQSVDGSRLIPVQYRSANMAMTAFPVLDTGGQECRQVNSAMSYGGSQTSALPQQFVCRTSDGDWEPYAIAKG